MEKSDLVRKIKRLMEVGASTNNEAEAMAMMNKARQMMDEYGIKAVDIKEKEEEWGEEGRKYNIGRSLVMHKSHLLSNVISQICRTQSYRCRGTQFFFGMKHEVEISHYMLEMVRNLMDGAYEAYKKSSAYKNLRANGVHAPSIKASFMNGMVFGLQEKLQTMVPKQVESDGTKNALVVQHQALMKQKLKEHNLDIRQSKANINVRNRDAAQTGKQAGKDAQLSQGVGSEGRGAGGTLLLGS